MTTGLISSGNLWCYLQVYIAPIFIQDVLSAISSGTALQNAQLHAKMVVQLITPCTIEVHPRFTVCDFRAFDWCSVERPAITAAAGQHVREDMSSAAGMEAASATASKRARDESSLLHEV